MATIHNIELDLFARTSTGEEINLGKVKVPITIDVNPRREPIRRNLRQDSEDLDVTRVYEAKRRAVTREEFTNLGNKK